MSDLPRLPDDYGDFLEQLKARVRQARVQATRTVNTQLLVLYWDIGRTIRDRQDAQGWGSRVLDRLATDLRAEFPAMRGFSRSNLHYMRTIAGAWAREAIVQQAVGQLPWGHLTVLIDKLDDQVTRDWYAAAAMENGWSRAVLTHQIRNHLHQRVGAAPTNFGDHLPPADSDLAHQLVRDPHVFDFLDINERVAERELEAALMTRLERFLLELGHGFAFAGRQYHFNARR